VNRKCEAVHILVWALLAGACTTDAPMVPTSSPEPLGELSTAAERRAVRITINCSSNLRGTDVLIAVDGVVWGRSDEVADMLREHVPRENIATVEVLRAASAVSRFGHDAADGVILIRMRDGYSVAKPVTSSPVPDE
jgi:hypothetical protein